MLRFLVLFGVCASLVLAACGEDDEAPSAAAEGSASETPADTGGAASDEEEQSRATGDGNGEAGTTLKTGDSQFGEAIFDGDDQAIYYFDKEQTEASECYGDCAAAWPPVLTKGEPRAREGAEPNLLGTTERDDGTTQVTYDGHPLYYYVDDPPGQILCHNVNEFGGLWLAVQPSGVAVQ